MNIERVRPVNDRLLLRRPPEIEEQVSPGGIVIPAAWTEHATDPDGQAHALGMRRWNPAVECAVLAVGPGERDAAGVLAPCAIEPGCAVLLTGQPCDSLDAEHFLVRERDVLAIVRRTAERATIEAAGDALLVELDAETEQAGAILIPEAHRRRQWSGVVISAGPGQWATQRDSHGLDVLASGRRRFRLRDGRPCRETTGLRPGDRVQLAPHCRSVELTVAGRRLLLVLSVQSVCYVARSAA